MSDAMITGTILACDRVANVLFISGSTYSYVCVRFAFDFEMLCNILDDPIRVLTPLGVLVIIIHVYCACPILFIGFLTCG